MKAQAVQAKAGIQQPVQPGVAPVSGIPLQGA